MGSIKKSYSAQARAIVEAQDEATRQYMQRAWERLRLYRNSWQEVDLDEMAAQFTPNGGPIVVAKHKLVIDDPTVQRQIYMDPSGYMRIRDTSRGKKGSFLDINGVPVNSYKQRPNESDMDFYRRKMAASHFIIKKLYNLEEE